MMRRCSRPTTVHEEFRKWSCGKLNSFTGRLDGKFRSDLKALRRNKCNCAITYTLFCRVKMLQSAKHGEMRPVGCTGCFLTLVPQAKCMSFDSILIRRRFTYLLHGLEAEGVLRSCTLQDKNVKLLFMVFFCAATESPYALKAWSIHPLRSSIHRHHFSLFILCTRSTLIPLTTVCNLQSKRTYNRMQLIRA